MLGFHPTIVPSSVAKRKSAGAVAVLPSRSKPEILNPCAARSWLKSVPVGAPAPCSGWPGAGMLTTRGTIAMGAPPPVRYNVDTAAALSASQNGEDGDSEMPQGFWGGGSTTNAGGTVPLPSTRFGTSAMRSVSRTTTLPSVSPWTLAARADAPRPAPPVENTRAPMIAAAAGYVRMTRMDLLLGNGGQRPSRRAGQVLYGGTRRVLQQICE